MSGISVERRDQVLMTRLSPRRFRSSTFFNRRSSTNGPLLSDLGTRYPPRFAPRRRTIAASEYLPFLRVLPSFLPQGDVGFRPPEALPSPPPRGWSMGFIATPRTLGRLPCQRLRPAFPTEISSDPLLPTSPPVARQPTGMRRISPVGRRRVAIVVSLATNCTDVPAERAIFAPPPCFNSTL